MHELPASGLFQRLECRLGSEDSFAFDTEFTRNKNQAAGGPGNFRPSFKP